MIRTGGRFLRLRGGALVLAGCRGSGEAPTVRGGAAVLRQLGLAAAAFGGAPLVSPDEEPGKEAALDDMADALAGFP